MKHYGWQFDNSYARLPRKFFAEQQPSPVTGPKLVIFNKQLATSLGLQAEELEQSGAAVFAGNELPKGAYPLAQAYAGHQFGHFTMLGDGRAILLGEQRTPSGERVDIQLKGAGRTPFSRGGDGRAALGPMLREYLISEAMYALGIPSTRSLAVVTTGEPVYRQTVLPGAILVRVASSHLRVGTFQYARQWGEESDLQRLADYAIARHFPHIEDAQDKYVQFLRAVMERQAKVIAQWQLVGFVHGVMNTDNMTISGETIDYGPCAFMDAYDPKTVFSSIDEQGRYAYGNQPQIGQWNLARFAEALLPLLHDEEEQAIPRATEALSEYAQLYDKYMLSGMRAKFGLFQEEEEDEALMTALLKMMETYRADYTNTFRALTFNNLDAMDWFQEKAFRDWYGRWRTRLSRQQQSVEDAHALMKKSNPAVIPRNHRVEEVLEAAEEQDDYRPFKQLLEILSTPYAHAPEQEAYTTAPEPTAVPYQTFCGT